MPSFTRNNNMFVDIQIDVSASDADRAQAYINARAGLKPENLENLSAYLAALSGGSQSMDSALLVIANPAIATVTFTGAPTAAQTCSINNVVFTARASGATGNEFNIGASVTESAANLAAAINASSSAKLLNSVRASSAAGVVTITASIPGLAGLGYHVSAGNLANTTAADFALASESQRITF